MEKKLVSVIISVFQGELFISRLLDSILNQTYNFIEVIIVNDGSTDRTGEIINGYYKKFSDKGIKIKYFFQKNAGQAKATKVALRHVEGKYFCMIDADDFFLERSIEARVNALEKKDISYVISNGFEFDEKDLKHPLYKTFESDDKAVNLVSKLFENLVVTEKMPIINCAYMFNTEHFNKSIKNEIFEASVGQNLQILLPISKMYKGMYIKDCLYGRVIRKNSHFHSQKENNLLKKNKKCDAYTEMLIHTLLNINHGDTQIVIDSCIPLLAFRNSANKFKNSLFENDLFTAKTELLDYKVMNSNLKIIKRRMYKYILFYYFSIVKSIVRRKKQ